MGVLDNIRAGLYHNHRTFAPKLVNARVNAEYRAEEQRIQAQFKRDLFIELRLVHNPKAEMLFEKIWRDWESHGLADVAAKMEDYMELIQ